MEQRHTTDLGRQIAVAPSAGAPLDCPSKQHNACCNLIPQTLSSFTDAFSPELHKSQRVRGTTRPTDGQASLTNLSRPGASFWRAL